MPDLYRREKGVWINRREQSSMRELLFMEPVFKETIWGGWRLKEVYGYPVPGSHTGECWGISAHKNGDCVIAGGTYKGMTLGSLWQQHRELFGGNPSWKEFPLLVKIIDAKQDLSIQVHPDNAYAAEHENGSLGKTECWYVLDCEPDTSIVIGHHAKDRQQVKEMIEGKRWEEFIRQVPVKKGDFFQINPGCVHAMILETQQSSDITYRVYDYDRLSDGKPRQLHRKQSMDVITAPYDESCQGKPVLVEDTDQVRRLHLVTCPYYSCYKTDVSGCWSVDFGGSFANVSILEGEGTVDGVPVKKGQHFIVPAGYGSCRFEGDLSFIYSQAM